MGSVLQIVFLVIISLIHESLSQVTIWSQEMTLPTLNAANWSVMTSNLSNEYDDFWCPGPGTEKTHCWKLCASGDGAAGSSYIYRIASTVGFQNIRLHYDIAAGLWDSNGKCNLYYNTVGTDNSWNLFFSIDEYLYERDYIYNLPATTSNQPSVGIKIEVTVPTISNGDICCYLEDIYLWAEPATNTPTTYMPTTSIPTVLPTTSIPTTSVPTTAIPTTAIPTTAIPTTAIPTTAIPTDTSGPTTAIPTTAIPTTTTISEATTSIASSTKAISTTSKQTKNTDEGEQGEEESTTSTEEGGNFEGDNVDDNKSDNMVIIVSIIAAVIIIGLMVFVAVYCHYMRNKNNKSDVNIGLDVSRIQSISTIDTPHSVTATEMVVPVSIITNTANLNDEECGENDQHPTDDELYEGNIDNDNDEYTVPQNINCITPQQQPSTPQYPEQQYLNENGNIDDDEQEENEYDKLYGKQNSSTPQQKKPTKQENEREDDDINDMDEMYGSGNKTEGP